jgi:hypothetical protein
MNLLPMLPLLLYSPGGDTYFTFSLWFTDVLYLWAFTI